LEVESSDWRALIQDPYAQDLAKPCGLEVGGARYDEVCQVSLHGGTSREFRKKSLRVELPEDAPYPGYARKTNLRAEYNDPSFLRNWLGLQLFRRMTGIPTPRARFVKLELNGEYYGLMVEMERIGGKFLREHGRDELQSMYEPDPDRHLFADGASAFVPLPDPALYPLAYQKHTGVEGDYSDLRALIEGALAGDWEESQALGVGQTRRLRELLDVEGFIDYLAVMALLQNHDHVKKNSYLSWQRDARGAWRWEIYPWDLDLTLGCLWDEATQDTLCDSLTLDEDPIRGRIPEGEPLIYPFLPFANLMIHLVAQDPALRSFLGWRVCQMLDDRFWWERLPVYLDAMEVVAREGASEDRRDLNETPQDHAQAVEQLRTFLRKREQFLRQYFACPL